MSSPIAFLIIIFVIAVGIDFYVVKGLQRFRKLRREVDMGGTLSTTNIHGSINRFKHVLDAIRERLKLLIPIQWIFLVTGVASIAYGQYLMEQRSPQTIVHPIAATLNDLYRLNIVNYDNVFAALPYFIGGAVLCMLTAMPMAWKQGFVNWADTWSVQRSSQGNYQSLRVWVGSLLFAFMMFHLSRHEYSPPYLILWLIVIVVFTQLFWYWDKNKDIDLSFKIPAIDLFLMVLLLTLGFAIGAFALQDIPVTIVPDEGVFWETARSIARGEFHPVILDSGVYTFPVASSYFQAWVLKIFGISFWGWRFSSVIPAVMTVLPLYLLAREWFGRPTALVACVMMVANPYFIAFERLGYNNSQAIFPVALCIYFFAMAARRGSTFYLWLAGLTLGLGFYTYFAAWLGLVTLCFAIFYLWLTKNLKWKQTLLVLGIILLAWSVMFLPRVAYVASGESSEGLVYKIFETSFVNNFYGTAYYGEADLTARMPLIPIGENQTIFYEPVIYGELLVRGTVRTVVSLFNPYVIFEHFLVSGLAGVITPVFFLIGTALSLRYRKQLRFALPLIWVSGGLVFLSILAAFPPRHTHLVSIIPGLALISAVGLVGATQKLTELLLAKRDFARGASRILVTTVSLLAITYYGFQRYYVTMPLTYPPTFEDIASWIAWRNTTPVHLIYVGQTDVVHRVEYLVKTGIAPHRYFTKLTSNFTPQSDLNPDEPNIIFVESGDLQTMPWLNELHGFRPPVVYADQNNNIIGYVITNTNLDLNPKVGIADGLHSLIDTPVHYLFQGLFVLLVVCGLLSLRELTGWPQKEILLEIGRPQSSPQPSDLLPTGERLEFNFHLRVRIPPGKRNSNSS